MGSASSLLQRCEPRSFHSTTWQRTRYRPHGRAGLGRPHVAGTALETHMVRGLGLVAVEYLSGSFGLGTLAAFQASVLRWQCCYLVLCAGAALSVHGSQIGIHGTAYGSYPKGVAKSEGNCLT